MYMDHSASNALADLNHLASMPTDMQICYSGVQQTLHFCCMRTLGNTKEWVTMLTVSGMLGMVDYSPGPKGL